MIKFIRNYSWCAWLGGGLVFLGYPVDSWRFWIVVLPVLILVALKED